MGSNTPLASSDVSSRLNIMTGFLSCRNASVTHGLRGVSQMALETPTNAQQSQARLLVKDPKSAMPAAPQKGVEESASPIWGKKAETQNSRNSVGK